MRPSQLAQRFGLSAQAVRNYEESGIVPPARRSTSGYRSYAETHAAGVGAYLALVPAVGHGRARRLLQAATAGQLDEVLTTIDAVHAELARDRATLRSVESALALRSANTGHHPQRSPTPHDLTAEHHLTAVKAAGGPAAPFTTGELARRLGIGAATLRAWERAGILTPARDPHTGQRRYRPADVREAELAHMLRRGGRPRAEIAVVMRELRGAGNIEALAESVRRWRDQLSTHGHTLLRAAGLLAGYLDELRAPRPG